MKTILVLTGGGETQVLNATLYGVIFEAKKRGIRVLGSIGGWAGVLNDKIIDLSSIPLAGIPSIGGTLLRTSRTNPFSTSKGIDKLHATFQKHSIDGLVTIGGDDTSGAACRLWKDYGVPLAAAPKTADNDLSATYFTPGFPTAAYNLIHLVNNLKRDCAIPRNRIFLVESQGGNAGWLPAAAILGHADAITIPECKVTLAAFLKQIKKLHKQGEGAVIVVSKESVFDKELGAVEEQQDSFGVQRKQHVVIDLQQLIKKKLKISAQPVIPSSTIRSGAPLSLERDLGKALGQHTVKLLSQGTYGRMAVISYKKDLKRFYIDDVPLSNAVGAYRHFTKDWYDAKRLLPTEAYIAYLKTIFRDQLLDDAWYYQLLQETSLRRDLHP